MLALKIKVVALKRTMIIMSTGVFIKSNIFLAGAVDMDKVHYCERFLELLVDLEVNMILIINA